MRVQDRWRRALKGRAWLEVRRDGVIQRRTPLSGNVVTDLGLGFLFWSQWEGQTTAQSPAGSAGAAGFFGTMSYNSYNGQEAVVSVGNMIYYDGTYYHASWANPLSMLYASTDTTTPSVSTNVLPGGTLIALGAGRNVNQGSNVVWNPPSGQSVSGSGAWDFSAITGTSPSIGAQTTTSTLVTIPFVPYAGSGTVTVGSVGFTNGLYASTSSTTSWTAINGAEMSLTGSTTPASTKNLSIGTKLIPSTTLSVTNGEQLVVNYEISFTPA